MSHCLDPIMGVGSHKLSLLFEMKEEKFEKLEESHYFLLMEEENHKLFLLFEMKEEKLENVMGVRCLKLPLLF